MKVMGHVKGLLDYKDVSLTMSYGNILRKKDVKRVADPLKFQVL